ncbi:MAG: hypothetical protein JG777_1702 [Clostridia bacterium]|jgi:putative tricarboxylic transport membrane protein|uniref:tripartite tricarboxylate transporter TctB family protein n=1 Tax=Petroclostridium xylanilyticum TaxID=1792311 RepID=UPI0012FFC7AA|nr:tripartite tricarboxylate transporter TctB family protein [Petroclostridium xylanilyticum]MBZ4646213.1 hypothetical protein [Clostridia bacterium]
MIKKYGDIISGSFLFVVAAVIFISSFSIKKITVSRIGAAFVPQLVGIFLAILSVVIIIGAIRQLKSGEQTNTKETAGEEGQINHISVIATFVLIALYIALLDKVGFLIMTAVYLFAQFYVLANKAERKIPLFAAVAVAASAVIYYTFVYGFQLMLPAGILG